MKRGGRAHDALTPDDVRVIQEHLAKGVSHLSLANDFDVAKSTISKIARGATWGHLTQGTPTQIKGD
jgi:IS30 family transposase